MLEHLHVGLEVLNSAEPADLSGPELLDRWQCPRTAPGFARAALDYLGAGANVH
ncbi:hypothetical protein ACFWG6_00510 [Streptomyces erythrochromogenes]|uniref:hypothetical protein n=1 Tax=Streptomyces erythrochromogenes TaxID=285574 RepID=UPI0036299CE4